MFKKEAMARFAQVFIGVCLLTAKVVAQDCNDCGGCMQCTYSQQGYWWKQCGTQVIAATYPAGTGFIVYPKGSRCDTCTLRINAADPNAQWGVWGFVSFSDFDYSACTTVSQEEVDRMFANKTFPEKPDPEQVPVDSVTPTPELDKPESESASVDPKAEVEKNPEVTELVDPVKPLEPSGPIVPAGNRTARCPAPGTYNIAFETFLRQNINGAQCGVLIPGQDIFHFWWADSICEACFGEAEGPVCNGVKCATTSCNCCGYVMCNALKQ